MQETANSGILKKNRKGTRYEIHFDQGYDPGGAGGDRTKGPVGWGGCGAECEFCSGCDNRGGGRIDSMYQPYIDGEKEITEINAEYCAPFVR